MKGKESLTRWLMVPGIAVAFGLGYLAARGGFAETRESGSGFQEAANSGSEGVSGDRGSRQVMGNESWKELRERLTGRWEASPAAYVDCGLQDETRRLLEKIPAADLEEWLREPLPDFRGDSDQNIPEILRDLILKVLAPRGGGALIRSLAENPVEESEDDAELALDLWIKGDPMSALVWMDGDIPESTKEYIGFYRECALVELSGKDPAEFEKRLALVDADTREDVLEEFSERRCNAEDRLGILERAARSPHGEAMALWRGLIRGECSANPKRAFATLAELGISDTDRAVLDQGLVESLLSGGLDGYFISEEDKTWVIQGWVERHPGQPAPSGLLASFASWSHDNSKPAMDWIANQPPGSQYDAFALSLVEQQAGSDETEFPAFAKIAARISDPSVRGAAQSHLIESWQSANPTQAAEWKAKLPAEDRDCLK